MKLCIDPKLLFEYKVQYNNTRMQTEAEFTDPSSDIQMYSNQYFKKLKNSKHIIYSKR